MKKTIEECTICGQKETGGCPLTHCQECGAQVCFDCLCPNTIDEVCMPCGVDVGIITSNKKGK